MSIQRVFLWDIRDAIDGMESMAQTLRRAEKDVERLINERDTLMEQIEKLEERIAGLEDSE